MTGSALLIIISLASTAIGLDIRYAGYAKYLLAISLIALVIFLVHSVIELIREKMVRINELEDLLTPKLSIIFDATKPYVENVNDIGSVECRKIRIGVKNDNLVKASKVCVKFESCFPSSKAISLKQDLMPTSVGTITLGPHVEQLFDVIVTHLATKDSRIAYNMTGPDASIEKHEHEFVISASCEESVPVKAKFRIEPGPDGFFVMRRC